MAFFHLFSIFLSASRNNAIAPSKLCVTNASRDHHLCNVWSRHLTMHNNFKSTGTAASTGAPGAVIRKRGPSKYEKDTDESTALTADRTWWLDMPRFTNFLAVIRELLCRLGLRTIVPAHRCCSAWLLGWFSCRYSSQIQQRYIVEQSEAMQGFRNEFRNGVPGALVTPLVAMLLKSTLYICK